MSTADVGPLGPPPSAAAEPSSTNSADLGGFERAAAFIDKPDLRLSGPNRKVILQSNRPNRRDRSGLNPDRYTARAHRQTLAGNQDTSSTGKLLESSDTVSDKANALGSGFGPETCPAKEEGGRRTASESHLL